jgi:hypothetical protein
MISFETIILAAASNDKVLWNRKKSEPEKPL